MKKYYSASILMLLTLSLCGQKGIELGAWLGLNQYYGDLHTELSGNDIGLAGGLNFRYNFDQRISLKTSLNYARLSASDEDSQNTFERQRNLSFFSDLWDLTTQAEFNFLPYVHGSDDEFFTPYLFLGFSVHSQDPRTELEGERFRLRDFGTEGQPIGEEYGRFAFATTLGLGMKWDINADWSFNVELSIHNSTSDYIDDVSTSYPDLLQLNIDRGDQAVALSDRSLVRGIGESGRQRGDRRSNDVYAFLGLSIMRYFGTIPCPKVSARKLRRK